MGPGEQATTRRPRTPGRPRLYEPDAERTRILAGTLALITQNGDRDLTMAEILNQSGLSTRAFYRHFQTKEDVIRELYRRDVHEFCTQLGERVEAGASPEDGIRIWAYEILGLAYDERWSERVSTFSSPVVQRVILGSDEQSECWVLLAAPLERVLETGLASGVFPAARPAVDIFPIRAMALEAVARARTRADVPSRREACEHILRFALPALRGG